MHWYEEGLRVDPQHAELHRNLGVIYLLLGRYDVGWPEYRWRWQMPGLSRPTCRAPLWTGQDLQGKSILLYPEQGRGDAIQFIRLAPILAECGADVVVQCDPAMVPIFSCVHGIKSLIPMGTPIPLVDYQASLIEAVDYRFQQTGELPTGMREPNDWSESTSSDKYPGKYIQLPVSLVDYWKHWLSTQIPGRKVGINWQGNPDHHADVYRSVPLESMAPLATLDQTTLVSLQFGYGSQQLESCSFGDRVLRLPAPLDTSGGAFMDTAAIIQSLDAIVTSDTSIAHLAAALGKPVFLLLGKVPDWRWLTSGDRSEWYPSIRLIRQTQLDDWHTPMDEVLSLLRAQQAIG